MEGDHSPSPSSNWNETTETLDLTQPMEEDDHVSLSGNLDEMVDWSQLAAGDLGDPPVLDPHIREFLSKTESPGGRGDEPNWPMTPKPPFDDPKEWVRWCTYQVETPTWWLELVKVPTSRDLISFAK